MMSTGFSTTLDVVPMTEGARCGTIEATGGVGTHSEDF